VETGKLIRNIREVSRDFSHIAVSPDGRRFVTISNFNYDFLFWDLATGAYRECTGHRGYINALVFSPIGNSFASGSGDKTIKIWDAETGQEIRTLAGAGPGTGNVSGIKSIAYSPNGQQIASCSSNDETITFWDVASGTILRSISVPRRTGERFSSISLIAYSPDGRKIAAAQQNRIRIFDAQTGRELFTLSDTSGPLSFSPDGSRLLSYRKTGGEHNIVIWNMDTGWETGRLNVGRGDYVSLVMSPDGKYLAIGILNRSVTIWGEE
jgi:WD40 repeat protein